MEDIGQIKYHAIMDGLIYGIRCQLRELITFSEKMLSEDNRDFVENLEVKLNNISSKAGNMRTLLKEYRKVKKEKPFIHELKDGKTPSA